LAITGHGAEPYQTFLAAVRASLTKYEKSERLWRTISVVKELVEAALQ
jgi:hypothetical protein